MSLSSQLKFLIIIYLLLVCLQAHFSPLLKVSIQFKRNKKAFICVPGIPSSHSTKHLITFYFHFLLQARYLKINMWRKNHDMENKSIRMLQRLFPSLIYWIFQLLLLLCCFLHKLFLYGIAKNFICTLPSPPPSTSTHTYSTSISCKGNKNKKNEGIYVNFTKKNFSIKYKWNVNKQALDYIFITF